MKSSNYHNFSKNWLVNRLSFCFRLSFGQNQKQLQEASVAAHQLLGRGEERVPRMTGRVVRAALCLAVLGGMVPCTAPEQPLRVPAVRRCRAVSFRRDYRDEAGAVGVRLRGGGAEDGVRGGGGGPGWELGRSERDNVVRVGGQPQGIMEDDEDENGIQFRDGGGMVSGWGEEAATRGRNGGWDLGAGSARASRAPSC